MVEMSRMKRQLARLVVPLMLCGATSHSHAQAIYKCQSEGKTVYSQERCPGAQVVDIPSGQSRGRPSGRGHDGNDGLRQEKRQKRDKAEAYADALKPFEEAPWERERRERRARWTGGEQAECNELNAQEKQQASVMHHSKDIHVANAAADAFLINRKRYRELGC